MSKEFKQAAAEIADTSYSRAVEHALHMAANAQTPKQALVGIGMGNAWDNPTWEDAIYALAYAHRRIADRSLLSLSPVAVKPKKKVLVAPPPPYREVFKHFTATAQPVGSMIDLEKLARMRMAGK
jgi:hypothetical protein